MKLKNPYGSVKVLKKKKKKWQISMTDSLQSKTLRNHWKKPRKN